MPKVDGSSGSQTAGRSIENTSQQPQKTLLRKLLAKLFKPHVSPSSNVDSTPASQDMRSAAGTHTAGNRNVLDDVSSLSTPAIEEQITQKILSTVEEGQSILDLTNFEIKSFPQSARELLKDIPKITTIRFNEILFANQTPDLTVYSSKILAITTGNKMIEIVKTKN